MIQKPTLVILAAGMGSRYGGLKQLDQFGPSGETIMEYSIYDAIRAGFGKIVFVIRKAHEELVKEAFTDKLKNKIKIEYAFQENESVEQQLNQTIERSKPWGTLHAVLSAEAYVNEPFAVLNADDFYGYEAFKVQADFLKNLNSIEPIFSMVGYELSKTMSEHGSVSRGIAEHDETYLLKAITEQTKIRWQGQVPVYIDEQGNQFALTGNEMVSMNFWGFTPAFFKMANIRFNAFVKENINNPKAEMPIPPLVQQLITEQLATVRVLNSYAQWFGVTYSEDRPKVQNKITQLIQAQSYPSNLWES